MSRQSLLIPLSVLLLGLLLIGQMLSRPNPRSNAQSNQETAQPTAPYTAPATSQVTSAAYQAPTEPPGNGQRPTARPNPTTPPQGGVTALPTFAAPVVPTPPVLPTVAAQATATPQPTATLQPTATPTVTPTPTPTPDPNRFSCSPGQEIVITGSGPANAGVLIRFAGRIVGGGSVESNGLFALTVVIGREEPGSHPVTVEVRGSRLLLRTVTCDVPVYSITPTPATRQTPTPTATFAR